MRKQLRRQHPRRVIKHRFGSAKGGIGIVKCRSQRLGVGQIDGIRLDLDAGNGGFNSPFLGRELVGASSDQHDLVVSIRGKLCCDAAADAGAGAQDEESAVEGCEGAHFFSLSLLFFSVSDWGWRQTGLDV